MTGRSDIALLAAHALTCAFKGLEVSQADLDSLQSLADAAGVDGQLATDALLVQAARVAVERRCLGHSGPALNAATRVYLECAEQAVVSAPADPDYYWKRGDMA